MGRAISRTLFLYSRRFRLPTVSCFCRGRWSLTTARSHLPDSPPPDFTAWDCSPLLPLCTCAGWNRTARIYRGRLLDARSLSYKDSQLAVSCPAKIHCQRHKWKAKSISHFFSLPITPTPGQAIACRQRALSGPPDGVQPRPETVDRCYP